MNEQPQLRLARERLSQAEVKYRSKEGLVHLEAGLELLEEVMAGGSREHRALAQNLAATYSTKIYGCIKRLVDTDRAVPEPELEHLFKVALAFDQSSIELPAAARATKVNLVRQLIDRYYEGYSAEEKNKVLEQLTAIARNDQGTQ